MAVVVDSGVSLFPHYFARIPCRIWRKNGNEKPYDGGPRTMGKKKKEGKRSKRGQSSVVKAALTAPFRRQTAENIPPSPTVRFDFLQKGPAGTCCVVHDANIVLVAFSDCRARVVRIRF